MRPRPELNLMDRRSRYLKRHVARCFVVDEAGKKLYLIDDCPRLSKALGDRVGMGPNLFLRLLVEEVAYQAYVWRAVQQIKSLAVVRDRQSQ